MTSTERRRVGLALGGGAVRGLAHLGVLAVLEREGIPIDCVAGSSAGAFIGSLYCAGLDSQHLIEIARQIGWRNLARPTVSGRGLFSFSRLERWVTALVGDLDFAQLEKPFAAVATDLETGESVVLREGRLAPAVRASCSIPGIVPPMELGGRTLVDGGISDNLPVAAARALGADYVIGVDVCCHTSRGRIGPLGVGFAAIEIMVRRAGTGIGTADWLITPDLAGLSYVRFSQTEELLKRGRCAAVASLPQIKEALGLGTGA
jgi:NTE family protein